MTLATLNFAHDPTCTGCPACNEEMARLLTMTATERCAWVHADRARLRTSSSPRRTFRVTQVDNFTPPDIYEKPLAQLRGDTIPASEIAAITMGVRAEGDYSAPNPYAAALALRRLQEEKQ